MMIIDKNLKVMSINCKFPFGIENNMIENISRRLLRTWLGFVRASIHHEWKPWALVSFWRIFDMIKTKAIRFWAQLILLGDIANVFGVSKHVKTMQKTVEEQLEEPQICLDHF